MDEGVVSPDDLAASIPSRLESVHIPSFEACHVYKVLPKSSSHVVGPQFGAVCDDISIQHGAHALMAVPVIMAITAGVIGPGIIIKPSDDSNWKERCLLWSAPVALPGSGG
jgi:hypothetical protein